MNEPGLWLAGIAGVVAVICATMGRNQDEKQWAEKEGEEIDNDAE